MELEENGRNNSRHYTNKNYILSNTEKIFANMAKMHKCKWNGNTLFPAWLQLDNNVCLNINEVMPVDHI